MKLSEKKEQFSDEEVIGYANSHQKNGDLTILINEIENLIFPSFNLKNKKQEIEAAKKYFISLH